MENSEIKNKLREVQTQVVLSVSTPEDLSKFRKKMESEDLKEICNSAADLLGALKAMEGAGLVCPIINSLTYDPMVVVTDQGARIYDRKAIGKWLQDHPTDPCSRQLVINTYPLKSVNLDRDEMVSVMNAGNAIAGLIKDRVDDGRKTHIKNFMRLLPVKEEKQ